jgi:hypothetical protein
VGSAVIKPFQYADFTDGTEKEQNLKGFTVKSARTASVSSVYKNHGTTEDPNSRLPGSEAEVIRLFDLLAAPIPMLGDQSSFGKLAPFDI